jgi:hypothetical protein
MGNGAVHVVVQECGGTGLPSAERGDTVAPGVGSAPPGVETAGTRLGEEIDGAGRGKRDSENRSRTTVPLGSLIE